LGRFAISTTQVATDTYPDCIRTLRAKQPTFICMTADLIKSACPNAPTCLCKALAERFARDAYALVLLDCFAFLFFGDIIDFGGDFDTTAGALGQLDIWGSSYPAASAVAQLKSYWELIAFIMTVAVRMKMICSNVLVVKILANSVT